MSELKPFNPPCLGFQNYHLPLLSFVNPAGSELDLPWEIVWDVSFQT